MTSIALIGRLDLAAYVSFGAFASVYSGASTVGSRWSVQARMGVLLTLAVTTGAFVATLDQTRWWLVPAAAGWAALGQGLSLRHAWRPPGPLFVVFAVATSSSIPTQPGDLPVVVLAVATTAAVAVLFGAIEERAWSLHSPEGKLERPHDWDWTSMLVCAAAAFLAGLSATMLGLSHPAWAVVAGVVPFAAVVRRGQLVRGVQRVLGTAVGLVLAVPLLAVEDPPWFLFVLVIAVLQGATELVVARHYGLALVFITPLALLLTQSAAPEPVSSLLASRLIETVLGVTIGITVGRVNRR
ncbi:FUSC family protein [Nocardioides zeicaulis]|uniref:FUSC family protein n=1 Tax=Nocardioides zeicaulis TaxID=1776857 RepID=UPI0039EE4AB6